MFCLLTYDAHFAKGVVLDTLVRFYGESLKQATICYDSGPSSVFGDHHTHAIVELADEAPRPPPVEGTMPRRAVRAEPDVVERARASFRGHHCDQYPSVSKGDWALMWLAADGTQETVQTGTYYALMAELAKRGEISPDAPRCTRPAQGAQYAVARVGDPKALAKAVIPRARETNQ
jgi:hypothetical protein